jgi:hypothetical protein
VRLIFTHFFDITGVGFCTAIYGRSSPLALGESTWRQAIIASMDGQLRRSPGAFVALVPWVLFVICPFPRGLQAKWRSNQLG